jgi:hypothetical protein
MRSPFGGRRIGRRITSPHPVTDVDFRQVAAQELFGRSATDYHKWLIYR